MITISVAGALRESESSNNSCKSEDCIDDNEVDIEDIVEGTLVEVGSVGLLQLLLSGMKHKGNRDNEEDESAADASCIGYENLGFLEEEYDYDNWD